jgi:hypothetical protein
MILVTEFGEHSREGEGKRREEVVASAGFL